MSKFKGRGSALVPYTCVPRSELAGLTFAPSPGALYLWLAAGPLTTRVPGVVAGGPLAIAEAIGWEPDDTMAQIRALEDAGKIITDRKARIVYLPSLLAAECSRPSSPSTAGMWRRELTELQPCELRERIVADARDIIEALGDSMRAMALASFDSGRDPQAGKPRKVPAPEPDRLPAKSSDSGPDRGPSRARSGSGSGSGTSTSTCSSSSSSKEIADAGASAPSRLIKHEESEQEESNDAADKAPAALELVPAGTFDNGAALKAMKKPKREPLPYSVAELLETLAATSSGRFVASQLAQGPTIAAQRLVRAHSLDDVRLAGAWLAAGGDGWKGTLDGRALKDLDAWVAQARAWDAKGRPGIAPTRAAGTRKHNDGIGAQCREWTRPDGTKQRLTAWEEDYDGSLVLADGTRIRPEDAPLVPRARQYKNVMSPRPAVAETYEEDL